MVLRELIDTVQQHHPDKREVEIRKLLNRASDDFCARTEIVKNTYKQTTTAGQRYYAIHKNIIKITELQIDDVTIPRMIGKPEIDDDEIASTNALATPTTTSNERYWYVDSGRIGIVEKSTRAHTRDGKTSDYQSISEALEMRIFVVSRASHFHETSTQDTYLSAESEIPSQFHEALAHKVIATCYLHPDNLNIDLSNAFTSLYVDLVKEGKKFARNQYRSTGFIRPQDF